MPQSAEITTARMCGGDWNDLTRGREVEAEEEEGAVDADAEDEDTVEERRAGRSGRTGGTAAECGVEAAEEGAEEEAEEVGVDAQEEKGEEDGAVCGDGDGDAPGDADSTDTVSHEAEGSDSTASRGDASWPPPSETGSRCGGGEPSRSVRSAENEPSATGAGEGEGEGMGDGGARAVRLGRVGALGGRTGAGRAGGGRRTTGMDCENEQPAPAPAPSALAAWFGLARRDPRNGGGGLEEGLGGAAGLGGAVLPAPSTGDGEGEGPGWAPGLGCCCCCATSMLARGDGCGGAEDEDASRSASIAAAIIGGGGGGRAWAARTAADVAGGVDLWSTFLAWDSDCCALPISTTEEDEGAGEARSDVCWRTDAIHSAFSSLVGKHAMNFSFFFSALVRISTQLGWSGNSSSRTSGSGTNSDTLCSRNEFCIGALANTALLNRYRLRPDISFPLREISDTVFVLRRTARGE